MNPIPSGNTVYDLGIFIGNAVSYSNAVGPGSFGAAIAAGEGTGRTASGGLSYNGSVIASLAYQKIDGRVSGDNTKLTGFGLGAPLGAFTVKGQWLRIDENRGGARIAEVDSFGIGADYAWSSSNTFNASCYNVKNKKGTNDRTNTPVLSNDHAFSKRTTLYIQGAFANPGSGATVRTTVIANGVRAGSNTSAYNVGISHNFRRCSGWQCPPPPGGGWRPPPCIRRSMRHPAGSAARGGWPAAARGAGAARPAHRHATQGATRRPPSGAT